MSYIYMILNIKNNKCYIGSTNNFKKRKAQHLRGLRQNKHHCVYLQRSYNKHGIENFRFILLEECDASKQFELEQFWIDKIGPEYNIGSVGGGDNYTNNPNKEEIYKKIVTALLTARRPEPRFGKDNPNYKDGRTITIYHCECGNIMNMNSTKCKKCNDNNRSGKNNPFYNKQHSSETKEKIRKANTNRKPPNEIQCNINGTIYRSFTEAAKCIGCSVGTIRNRINSPKFEQYNLVI